MCQHNVEELANLLNVENALIYPGEKKLDKFFILVVKEKLYDGVNLNSIKKGGVGYETNPRKIMLNKYNSKNTTSQANKQIKRQARRRRLLRRKNLKKILPVLLQKISGLSTATRHNVSKDVFNNILQTLSKNKTFYKRQDTVAKEIGYSRRTVNTAIKTLAEQNFITVEDQGHKRPRLITTSPLFQNLDVRNALSKLLPALKYLPLVAIIQGNFSQDINYLSLYKNINSLRSQTQVLNSPKYSKKAPILFKNNQKEERGDKSTIPSLFFKILVKQILEKKAPNLTPTQKKTNLTATINKPRESSEWFKINKIKKDITPGVLNHTSDMPQELTIAQHELEEFRNMVIRSRNCTPKDIEIYNDFRQFLKELNLPTERHTVSRHTVSRYNVSRHRVSTLSPIQQKILAQKRNNLLKSRCKYNLVDHKALAANNDV